jgi:hypothetical protein
MHDVTPLYLKWQPSASIECAMIKITPSLQRLVVVRHVKEAKTAQHIFDKPGHPNPPKVLHLTRSTAACPPVVVDHEQCSTDTPALGPQLLPLI